MATLTRRIKVSNDRASFITLWLEPWGEDYGMSPGDELEVVAAEAAEGFYFYIAYDEEGMKVYAEGDAKHVSLSTRAMRCSRAGMRGEKKGGEIEDDERQRGMILLRTP